MYSELQKSITWISRKPHKAPKRPASVSSSGYEGDLSMQSFKRNLFLGLDSLFFLQNARSSSACWQDVHWMGLIFWDSWVECISSWVAASFARKTEPVNIGSFVFNLPGFFYNRTVCPEGVCGRGCSSGAQVCRNYPELWSFMGTQRSCTKAGTFTLHCPCILCRQCVWGERRISTFKNSEQSSK